MVRHIRPIQERVIRLDPTIVMRAMSTEEAERFGPRLPVRIFRFTDVNRLSVGDELRAEIERQLCGQWRQARTLGRSLGDFASQHGTKKSTLREVFKRWGNPPVRAAGGVT